MRDSGVRGIDRVDPFKDFHHGLLEVPPAIDLSHAPLADEGGDIVVAESGADGEGHGR